MLVLYSVHHLGYLTITNLTECKVGRVAALVQTTSDAPVLTRYHTFLDIAFLPIPT